MPSCVRAGALIALLVVACGRGASTTTTTTSTAAESTTTAAAPTSTSQVTTTTTLPQGTYVLPVATEKMPESWTEVFLIPYGETPQTLGTSLSGDGDGLLLGPDYGAQAPDGSWWFLDVAKQRMAHFGDDGAFGNAVLQLLIVCREREPHTLGEVIAGAHPGFPAEAGGRGE